MVRGLMVVVLALAATTAHAQEAKAAGSTNDAATPEGADPAIVLASRSTPERRPPNLVRSAGSPDAEADSGPMTTGSTAGDDCSAAETYLSGGTLAVRAYPMPSTPRGPDKNAWEQPPYVKSITRCDQRYVLQVRSWSKDTWVIDRARLEGPKGETLQLKKLRFNQTKGGWMINVISAEAPPGAKLSKLNLHLTGQDGRVAQVEAEDLP